MTKQKTKAVVLVSGYPVAVVETAASGGEAVCYGYHIQDGCLLQTGTGRVTRNKKYLGNDDLMNALEIAYCNHGGGGAM